jgi:hypothetical protein
MKRGIGLDRGRNRRKGTFIRCLGGVLIVGGGKLPTKLRRSRPGFRSLNCIQLPKAFH